MIQDILTEKKLNIRQLSLKTGIPYTTLYEYSSGKRDFRQMSLTYFQAIAEAQVLLMHKNTPIVSLELDYDGNVLEIFDVQNEDYLPLSVKRNTYNLKNWLKERAIPKTRDGIVTVLKLNKEHSTQALLIRNLALSLNDTYWIRPVESDYESFRFPRKGTGAM